MSEYTREQVIEKIKGGESLQGADLSDINLSRVDFRPKKLGGICEKPANFIAANLSGANFRGADLCVAKFIAADLSIAKLSEANLSRAELSGADLIEADLIEADLSGANLFQANLFQANLFQANLFQANLYQAELSKANLSGANLNKSDLSKADLIAANLFRAELNKTNLSQADFIMAELSKANFTKANLSKAELSKANLSHATFDNADLTNADISGANIYQIKMHGWKIDGIRCTHVYQCPDWKSWEDTNEREKYRRDFSAGELEALHRPLPKIELIFQQGFSLQDHMILTIIIEQINRQLPSPVEISEMKKAMNTYISLTSEKRDILNQVAPMINEMYRKIEDLRKIPDKDLSSDEWFSEFPDGYKFLIKKQFQKNVPIKKPDIYIDTLHFEGSG